MPVKWVAYDIKGDNREVTIRNSENQVTTSSDPQKLLDFLYINFKDSQSRELKFFWDIDSALSLIFRLMDKKDLIGIYETKTGRPYNLWGYDVSYTKEHNFIIRGNFLINDRPYWSCFYGIKQYFQNENEPKDLEELIKYGLKLKNALTNIGITTPLTLSSAISIWESSMRTTQSTMIPSITNIPADKIDVLKFAEACAQRQGFITNPMVGYFKEDEVYSYDISGAYGAALSQSRDFTEIEITQYTPDYPHKDLICKGNVTGYFEVNITIFPHVKIHPFAFKTQQNDLIYSTGTYPTFLSLEEMLSIIKNKKGIINKVIDGYYVRFLNHGRPFEHLIQRLFNMRELGEVENGLCKSIIVQMVGKSLMVNKETGEPSKTYNPLLVALVYARCRLQVFDFILKNHLEDSTVAIATDEVISTQPATITKIETGKKIMGTWREKERSPMIILSPGWIISNSKNPHGLNCDTFIKALKENPNTSYYKFPTQQRITLFKGIESEQINKIGEYYEASNTIDLSEIAMSQDRIFAKFPQTGKQLLSNKIYKSEPVEV